LGDALAARGRLDEALAAYEEAVRLDPDHADALCNLGSVRLTRGDLAGAEAAFTRALAAGPHGGAEYHLGTVRLKEGKPAAALPHFERACRLEPADARFLNNYGVALQAVGQTDEAVRRFRAAIALDPKQARSHAALAQILMGRNETADAIAHYRAAVRLREGRPATMSALAWLLATAPDAKLRDGPEAVRLAEEACRRTAGRDPTCLDALSAAYAEVGRFDEAVRAARAALAAAEAAGAAEQAAVIRRRIPVLEARRPLHP
jgi:Flp pilus assembly protein TadD